MYGGQYETRQRVRPPPIQNYQQHNMPVAEGQAQSIVNPCRGTWQWA
uniref:Uncharacterized protein n=1 Tax=Acrobeloides nanus TaxID=290746 RepID=A0A914DI54_9BILA